MSSVLSSHSMVLATAMALSGTVILFALRHQKYPPPHSPPPPSCIVSTGDEERKEKRKKKKVHFAEDVVDPVGNGDLYRKKMNDRYLNNNKNRRNDNGDESNMGKRLAGCEKKKMQGNRVALYNGILRDRVCHSRATYSY